MEDNSVNVSSLQDDSMRSAPSLATVLHIAGATDPGRKRANNEDAYFLEPDGSVFGVFDGMGGMVAGEEASRIACEQVKAFFTLERLAELSGAENETVRNALQESFRAADTAIRAFAEERDIHRIGTTAVVALRLGNRLCVANMGDSRGYLLRRREPLKQLTRDHTVAAVLVELGEMTAEEARDPGARNRLLASLGDMGKNKPHFAVVDPILPGDHLLLCSDGLWDMVENAGIERLLHAAETPEAAASALIEAANEAGGDDNITTVVLFAE